MASVKDKVVKEIVADASDKKAIEKKGKLKVDTKVEASKKVKNLDEEELSTIALELEDKDDKKSVSAKKTSKTGEVWGILHIYSSYNNTHLHVTDVTGTETISKVTGGMVTKSDRLKATPNVAMAAAKQVSEACHSAGITSLYVKLRAVGGHNGPMTPGPGSQAAIKMLTRYGIKLGRIEDVTPVPHDSCRKKGGKRGRRV